MNLELLADSGYPPADFAKAGPNDLVMAIECPTEEPLGAAAKAAYEMLASNAAPGNSASRASFGNRTANPRGLDAALARLEGANLAVISLPGAYAAREALEKGLHVMLFSDNVSLEEEVSPKTFAREKGLLVMGPDCGTAILQR